MGKKILLVSNAFLPEISPRSFRATELAREFNRQGHAVTVLTKFRDHNYETFVEECPVTLKMWPKPLLPEVPKLSGTFLGALSRAIKRGLSLFFEYPAIEEMFTVKRILKNEDGYDLLISFAIPYTVHWGVAWANPVKRGIAGTWVADCGDPYMFARLDTFKKPFYFKYIEKNFCRKCNYLTVPAETLKKQFYPEFALKIKAVPQGFNFKGIKLWEGESNCEFPVFIFAGSIIPGLRDLSLLLEFLSSLKIKFQFIIYTNQMEWFQKFKPLMGDKLILRDYIERLDLIYEMSKADFLINVDTILESENHTEAIPSKLIDYALSGSPILNINSRSLDKELVMQFLSKDYSRRRVVDLQRHEISRVASQFIELIRNP